MNTLKGILETPGTRVREGEPFTHVSKSSPYFLPGKYFISREKESEFQTSICNAVRSGAKITIAEKGQPYAPLRVDFDFQADIHYGTDRFYTEDDVKCLVKYYQNEIRAIINPDDFRDELLVCIVLEKENARVEDGKLKDGFHFHFPHFVCEAKVQDEYLREKVVNKIVGTPLFAGKGLLTPLDKIIDSNIASKPWMMYGSMNFKTNESTPYMYNRKQSKLVNKDPWAKIEKEWGHVYDLHLNEIPMQDVFAEEMIGRQNSIRYYLPIFMSIRGYSEVTPLKPEIEKKMYMTSKKPKRKGAKIINKNRSDKDVYEDLKKITDGHIMDMLSIDRANNYDDWIDVGFILFNIANGKEEGLNMWIEFSQRSSERYKPGECEDLWETMEVRNKTIAGLFALARTDSPEEYQRWKNTNKYGYLEQSLFPLKPNPYDVSMVVVASADGRFKCVNPKKDIWYEFDNHRWRKANDALALKRMLVDDVIQDYFNYNADLGLEAKASTDEQRRTAIGQQQKKIWVIVDRLKNVQFQEHVIKMCKIRMTDEGFFKKANANTMLVCCENGVLDLELGIFRDGKPDDYCTISTGQYYQEYEDGDVALTDLEEDLIKTFPNPNLRNYFLDMSASCLEGGNTNKRIFICTGKANGGKSRMMRMLELAFGEYFGKFPRELFLRGRGASVGSARPELIKAEGKRIMSTQEITHMDNFDIGPLKEMSGNDTVSARGMYQEEERDIAFQFSTIFQCNEPPRVPGNDEATWSRMRLLDFESHFVIDSDLKDYPVPETFEEQLKMKRFRANPSLMKRTAEFANVLLWKLFRHYNDVYKQPGNGLREPAEVMMSTDAYKTKNNIYKQFFEEKIEKVKGDEAKKAYIGMSSLYSEFKDWHSENHPSYRRDLPGSGIVKGEMIKRMGQIKDPEKQIYGYGDKNRFWGYKLIYDERDDEEDDEKKKRRLDGNTA
jgi:phage/plasmid-associated DNA primase